MTTRKSFASDNHAGAHDAVLRALTEANTGDAAAYGEDPWTARASAELAATFGAAGGVFFVFTGTAANVLGLSLLLRPYEAVICAESAHLNVDECGAAERVLGCKLLTVEAADGKLTPALVASRLGGRGDEHRAQPRVVAISQVTEYGTCYTLAELAELAGFCRAEGLRLFADGARLANAAAWLGCPLADIAAQVDVLSFGGTKNGAVGAEAVVVMAADLAEGVAFQRKQQMQLASKMRYLSAQFAGLLADGLAGVPGVTLWQPVQSNAVFAVLHPDHIARLQRDWRFYLWDETAHVVRWMAAFDTAEADVDSFLASIRETARFT